MTVKSRIKQAGWVTVAALMLAAATNAQPAGSQQLAQKPLLLRTDTVAARRFIAVHGHRGMVAGYASSGLEVWAYPFQIVSGYRVDFRPVGAATAIPGAELLSRVEVEPQAITRIYLGPGLVVRERIFVPLDEPGAIVSYTVEGSQAVEIDVHATPVLDLMWPGALGGQSAQWNPEIAAYTLSEPAEGYSAVVGSPDSVAHDEIGNRTAAADGAEQLGLTLRPDKSGHAHLMLALNAPHTSDAGALYLKLAEDEQAMEREAAQHYDAYRDRVLRVETPEARVNAAMAWSEIALEQAWVCNPALGCGYVGGYGPSRGARRPQYDWFFAGDGLVAAEASLAVGEYERAREELEFILRYQDRKTGMIWHELSQSAGLIDWAGKFPYMYVHVDVSFQFLSAVAHYVTTSGDTEFARKHWPELQAAYRYCNSIVDPASGLPKIPNDKEGGDEQDRIADDLGLSTSWVDASEGFAALARIVGHEDDAVEAAAAGNRARKGIGGHYWDAKNHFWISGFTAAGESARERRSGPTSALTMHLFSDEQATAVLERLAGSAFQTDWGTRSVEAGSPGYDAESYAKGSVWAVGTSAVAEDFWQAHRPLQAMSVWQTLLPWLDVDAPGHMDEVMSGATYHPQEESVPEQTWSSAGFVTATVHGLLGLDVDGIANRVTFQPHLPCAWKDVSVSNVRLSHSRATLSLEQADDALTLHIQNVGTAFDLDFSPQIPLGAQLVSAHVNGRLAKAQLAGISEETTAHIAHPVAQGETTISINWRGGVCVSAPPAEPLLGNASKGLRLTSAHLDGDRLTLEADVINDESSSVSLHTAWSVSSVDGATVTQRNNRTALLTFKTDSTEQMTKPTLHHVHATVLLGREPHTEAIKKQRITNQR